jgi:hypothetical protein
MHGLTDRSGPSSSRCCSGFKPDYNSREDGIGGFESGTGGSRIQQCGASSSFKKSTMTAAEGELKSPFVPLFSNFFKGGIFLSGDSNPSLKKRGRGDFRTE